ncbi:hypothetical protein Pryu01_01250 [Paraliobacillus ryukyuensis]|uniref:Uncharacterized protein n=1 Tax=Paraliobacillus ryukyuensis TaxID=200904 RepID=A0A366EAX5_9BACI|nr:hypothetical protein DES48_104192 [Paraliobacillus ryukyuensis]
MTKLYVQEHHQETPDGDVITTIKTYKSKPTHYSYIIFI